MWEYKIQIIDYDYNSQLIDILNREGEDSWEVCSVNYSQSSSYYTYTCEIIFKRKKQ